MLLQNVEIFLAIGIFRTQSKNYVEFFCENNGS